MDHYANLPNIDRLMFYNILDNIFHKPIDHDYFDQNMLYNAN